MLIIRIRNDGTGTNEESNYVYDVSINGKTILEAGKIKGHDRSKGWSNLVRMLLEEHRLKTIKELFG